MTESRQFPIRGESQVIGQTGGAIEGAPTRWAGQDGGPVVSIGFSVIRAPILQAVATMGEVVGTRVTTCIIVGLVTQGTEIPLTKEGRLFRAS